MTTLHDAALRKTWAAGEFFTLADCAAAPGLFYAEWCIPSPGGIPTSPPTFSA